MNNRNCLIILLLLQSINLFSADAGIESDIDGEWDFGDVTFSDSSNNKSNIQVEELESRSSSEEFHTYSKKTSLSSSSNSISIPVPKIISVASSVMDDSDPIPRRSRRTIRIIRQ